MRCPPTFLASSRRRRSRSSPERKILCTMADIIDPDRPYLGGPATLLALPLPPSRKRRPAGACPGTLPCVREDGRQILSRCSCLSLSPYNPARVFSAALRVFAPTSGVWWGRTLWHKYRFQYNDIGIPQVGGSLAHHTISTRKGHVLRMKRRDGGQLDRRHLMIVPGSVRFCGLGLKR